jgi:hypothetical protein
MVDPVGQPAGDGLHQSRAYPVSGVCDLGWMFVPRHSGAGLSADLGENDFTLARGWFMGFAKRLGQIYLTEYHPLNPRMPLFGPGAKMKGYVCAHGERLIEGTLEIEKKIACEELPRPMGLPIFHIRHFPSIVRGAPPSVLELVRLGAENVRYGEDIWAGRGTLRFFPSEIEEHLPLAPLEILGASRGIASLAGRCCIAGSRV